MVHIIFLLGIGLMAGIASGLFGIGGGIIIVPLLTMVFSLEQKVASATSLVSMLLPVGILGVWSYYKANIIHSQHIKMGLIISIGLLVGALFGSKISILLSSKLIGKGFSILLLYVAFKIWIQNN